MSATVKIQSTIKFLTSKINLLRFINNEHTESFFQYTSTPY